EHSRSQPVPSETSHRQHRLSARGYFALVALVTALGFVIWVALRPTVASSIAEELGLLTPARATSDSFYTARVAGLLGSRCVACHGPHRQKAKLRLDSYAAVIRGGKHGPVVVAGHPEASELIKRIELPQKDEKAMPPDGRTPFKKDEATIVKMWIAAGASGA